LRGGKKSLTPTDWQAIKRFCRQIRQSSIPQESSVTPIAVKPVEISAALNWLANRQSPRSIVDLDLFLNVEAEALDTLESGEATLSAGHFPWQAQAKLPPVLVTPLFPLPR